MLILASNSPRRKQLLELTGWTYQVLAISVDESATTAESPHVYVRRLAQEKAQAVLGLIPPAEARHSLVVAADTAVVDAAASAGVAGKILGKPADDTEAASMLRQLRSRTHQVYTGLAVMRPGDGAFLSEVVVTEVFMRDYSDMEIQTYVASGDPLDKAGAYAIQHADFHPVQNLQGCYANVMGLPVCHLVRMLEKFGLKPGNSIADACQESLDHPCLVFNQVMQEKVVTDQ